MSRSRPKFVPKDRFFNIFTFLYDSRALVGVLVIGVIKVTGVCRIIKHGDESSVTSDKDRVKTEEVTCVTAASQG